MRSTSKMSLLWGFLVSVVATGVILYSVPLDEEKLGFYRIDAKLQQETALREVLASRCSQLVAKDSTVPERQFLERYSPSAKESGQVCQLTIESASRGRFGLLTYSHFVVRISAGAAPIFERHYSEQAPRPLVFLPLAALLLAMVFEMPFWGLASTLVGFLFALSGLNLIAALNLAWRSVRVITINDPSLPGYCLIALWLALLLAHTHAPPPKKASRRERWGNRVGNTLLGLWNPGVYTIAGQLLFPVRNSLARTLPFLDMQLVLVGLSLYLFALDMHQWREFLKTGLLLPRYFTYTTLLFITISNWSLRAARRQASPLQMPGIWRGLAAVTILEALAWQLPQLKSLPTTLRFGVALVAGELIWPVHLDFKKAIRTALPWVLTIVLASFATSLCVTSGALDLMLVITEPRIHPVGLVFFTFVAGIAMGFVGGAFSTAFFALFTLLVKSSAIPLVRAALLDGIFAGILLSPFSLYNMLPAVQFGLAYQEILKFRFKQLLYPLSIGSIIYAVAAVNSVAILRPATFVFLCLAALAFQLRKSYWQIGSHTFSLEKAPR